MRPHDRVFGLATWGQPLVIGSHGGPFGDIRGLRRRYRVHVHAALVALPWDIGPGAQVRANKILVSFRWVLMDFRWIFDRYLVDIW